MQVREGFRLVHLHALAPVTLFSHLFMAIVGVGGVATLIQLISFHLYLFFKHEMKYGSYRQ